MQVYPVITLNIPVKWQKLSDKKTTQFYAT